MFVQSFARNAPMAWQSGGWAGVEVADVPLDQERPGGVREHVLGGGPHLDGAQLVAALVAVFITCATGAALESDSDAACHGVRACAGTTVWDEVLGAEHAVVEGVARPAGRQVSQLAEAAGNRGVTVAC